MDIINLFDQKTAINKNMTQLQTGPSSSARPTSTPAAWTSPRRRRSPAVQNPLFLQVNDYQLPRIIRFSARFSF